MTPFQSKSFFRLSDNSPKFLLYEMKHHSLTHLSGDAMGPGFRVKGYWIVSYCLSLIMFDNVIDKPW